MCVLLMYVIPSSYCFPEDASRPKIRKTEDLYRSGEVEHLKRGGE